MPTPVLIAAKNEVAAIGQTLGSLPRDGLEPIVIANGCEDATAARAQQFGATVLELSEAGKLSALQAGLRFLGRQALEPVLLLDADSRPVFPRYWLGSMLASRAKLDHNRPAVVAGMHAFEHGHAQNLRTLRRIASHYQTRWDDQRGIFSGCNMLLHAREMKVLDGIDALPELWPGEDRAIKDVVVDNGGQTIKSLGLRAMVWTDGSRFAGLSTLVREGRAATLIKSYQSYLDEAPAGSIPYQRSLLLNREAPAIVPAAE